MRGSLIYLDMCCFNRPYDAQTQLRVRLETDAKLRLQEMIKNKELSLVWSYILDYETSLNPFLERKQTIESWRFLAAVRVMESESVIVLAEDYVASGIKEFDALHVACAQTAQAILFVSTDDRLLNKLRSAQGIKAVTPLDALAYLEKWHEN